MSAAPELWMVSQHGGRNWHRWRVIFTSNDEAIARLGLEHAIRRLRLGSVRLSDPAGHVHVTVNARQAARISPHA